MVDVGRLRALLDTPDTAWIVERIRMRLERGQGLTGMVTLRAPSVAQRAAVAGIFGGPTSAGQTLAIDLTELDALLRRAVICDGLAQAASILVGAVANRREARDTIEARWAQVFEDAERMTAGQPPLDRWMAELRATGVLRRLASGDPLRARELVQQAMALAERLPASGASLAELAVTVAGDSHALDAGAPLGTIAIRLASVIGDLGGVGIAGRVTAAGDGIRGTGRARDVWTAVGVLCDELSAPVLVLNLAASPSTHTGRAMAAHREAGEPYRLSVRQLLRDVPDFDVVRETRIYICENPNVISAAANRLGVASAPLVCVEGQPRTAARLLLERLATAGARLAYHGDFDWGGIHIGNAVIGDFGASAWRFSAPDYEMTRGGRKLTGRPASARWDSALSSAMKRAGRAVHEEQVMNDLLSDLSQGDGQR